MSGLVMKYFVLKPDGTNIYSLASRHAILTYADVIRKENPEMAFELVLWMEEVDLKEPINEQECNKNTNRNTSAQEDDSTVCPLPEEERRA